MRASTTYRLEPSDPISATELMAIWNAVRRHVLTMDFPNGSHAMARIVSNHFTESDVEFAREMLLAGIAARYQGENELTLRESLDNWMGQFHALRLELDSAIHDRFAGEVFGRNGQHTHRA